MTSRGCRPDRATQVAAWLLPFTAQVAVTWGRLPQDLGHGGAELMIAAGALAREATVVTGNTKDFRPISVLLENPL